MNYYSRRSILIVSFNRTANGKDWKQPGGRGISITKNIAAKKIKQEAVVTKLSWAGGLE